MLTYDLEKRTGQPLYLLLYRAIREDILSGKLSGKLPSKRTLAQHLKLSTVTVENAYAQLIAEGFIESIEKKGYFVSEIPAISTENRNFTKEKTMKRSDSSVFLDLRNNQPDPAVFPFSVWSKLMREVLSGEDREKLLGAADPCGVVELREAIAESLYRLRGLEVSPENILIGAGTDFLYNVLAQLLGRQAVFAVEDPGYPKIRQVYTKCGAHCVPVSLDDQGMNLSALYASGATAIHISPSHHYPTGIVTPIGRRQALLRWAEEVNGIIIEDDYDSEFRFTGRPIPTLQSIDHGGRVVYMNTFSQTISPSMRVGFMVLPPRLLEQYRQELDFYACTVPALEQHVLARFLSGGHYEQHLSRMRKEYRTRRAAVLEAFRNSSFAQQITISEQGAGLHFLLRLNTRQSDEALRRQAEHLGVRLSFLSEFAADPHPDYDHTLVVNYAGLHPEHLEETVMLLEQVFT